jgi:O-antigen biosynthesis protein
MHDQTKPGAVDELIGLSVIIATYQREGVLGRCLAGLFAADQPSVAWEIIVVDDGGGLSRDMAGQFPSEVVRWVYLLENRGQAVAQEQGRKHARGRVLAFLDDDCVVHRRWLGEVLRYFESHPEVSCVVGKIEALDLVPILSRTRQQIYEGRHQRYLDPEFAAKTRARWQLPPHEGVLLSEQVSGGNFSIRREALAAIGGLDHGAAWRHDHALSEKLLEAGTAIAYNPDMIIYHQHAATLGSIYRVARRKMSHRFALHEQVRLAECGPLLLDLARAPWAAHRRPEMFQADRSRFKVWLAVTCVHASYALGGLLTFVQRYPRSRRA